MTVQCCRLLFSLFFFCFVPIPCVFPFVRRRTLCLQTRVRLVCLGTFVSVGWLLWLVWRDDAVCLSFSLFVSAVFPLRLCSLCFPYRVGRLSLHFSLTTCENRLRMTDGMLRSGQYVVSVSELCSRFAGKAHRATKALSLMRASWWGWLKGGFSCCFIFLVFGFVCFAQPVCHGRDKVWLEFMCQGGLRSVCV